VTAAYAGEVLEITFQLQPFSLFQVSARGSCSTFRQIKAHVSFIWELWAGPAG